MIINIISYRFYYSCEKFESKYKYIINLLNKIPNIHINEYRYVSHDRDDINFDNEKKINALFMDFSAYIDGLTHIYKNNSLHKHMHLNLFINDSFFKKWPFKLVSRRLISMIDKNLITFNYPLGIGQVENANNSYSNKFNSKVMATHFFILNYKTSKFLLKINNDIKKNNFDVDEILNLHSHITLKSNSYLSIAHRINDDIYKNKYRSILFEYTLSKYLFNKGLVFDVFNSRLIKFLYFIKNTKFLNK